jgi:T5orf172 domain
MTKNKKKTALPSLYSTLDYRYIYILGNTRYIFRYKIGIARSIENRTRGINNTLNGNTYEIFSVKVFFAQRIEQFLHGVYSPLSARMHGSGKTEWFWLTLPVSPMILLTLIFVLQCVFIPLLIVGLSYLVLHQEQLLSAILPQ